MAKKAEIINECFQGKRSFINTVDDYCDLLKEEIQEIIEKYMAKNLEVEIRLAQPGESL